MRYNYLPAILAASAASCLRILAGGPFIIGLTWPVNLRFRLVEGVSVDILLLLLSLKQETSVSQETSISDCEND